MRGRTGLTLGARGGAIDLGTEPPLLVGGEEEQPVRRTVSIRWLCGTILTGLASTFLMGGALMAALNNPNQFAARPDSLQAASADPTAGVAFGRKGDRMRPTEEAVASRRSSRSPPSPSRASGTSSSSVRSPGSWPP